MVFEIIKQREQMCQDFYAVSALPNLLALVLQLSCEVEWLKGIK
jgi:hypothetical protein